MPTLAEPNLETLRPPGSSDGSDFVELGYRPVFKEHTNRAGQKIGQRELSGIATRCNDRILDTGDYVPLVIRHTKDDGSYDPEVIGLVGPFRMSKFGNKKPVPAIDGKVWVYAHKAGELKKYPRLSVEFWADPDNPGNGYFDPISLLGAETPELDLGVHYSKLNDGRQLMRYSLVERFKAGKVAKYQAAAVTPAMPGSSNTFVPALAGDDRDKDDERDARAEDRDRDGEADISKQQQFSKESGPMQFSPEDLQQFVAAMKPVVEQICSEQMAAFIKSQPGGGDGDDLGDDLDGDEMPGDELGLGDDPDLDVGDDLDGLDDPEGDDLDGLDADGDGLDADDAGDDMDLGDDSDDSPPEIDDEMPAGDVAGESDETEPLASDEDEEDEDKMSSEASAAAVQKYQKEASDLRQKYAKVEARAKDAEGKLKVAEVELAALRAEKRKAERYSKLAVLESEGVAFDKDEEFTDTEPLNDEQFDRHLDKMRTKYQRAPVGRPLYVPASEFRDGVPGDEKRERYAKDATRVTLELRDRGIKTEYSAVLANIQANNGKYIPAA